MLLVAFQMLSPFGIEVKNFFKNPLWQIYLTLGIPLNIGG
jgi:hypothetical protein